MLVIIIIVSVVTASAASTLAASAGSAMGFGAGSTMAAATAGTAATAATATWTSVRDAAQKRGSKVIQALPDFSNGRKAFEHYAKQAKGVVLGGKGKALAKSDGADMPEFSSLDSYVSAAKSFWSPAMREGALQGTRADGSILRFEPSTGYFGVMRNGKINTFFRPEGDAGVRLKYFQEQL